MSNNTFQINSFFCFATYSLSIVEKATQFCNIDHQLMHSLLKIYYCLDIENIEHERSLARIWPCLIGLQAKYHNTSHS